MRVIGTLLASLLLVSGLLPAAAMAADDVDLLLVLAVDVSRSIDATKFQLQRDGYAAAVADARVLEAIQSGHTGRIGLTLLEWSGVGAQKVVVDWMSISDANSAKGITINGLVILSDNPMSWNPDHTNPPGGLANYYRNNVIGGPNAFVMVAENFNSFGQAIIKKMIAEVAENSAPKPLRAAAR